MNYLKLTKEKLDVGAISDCVADNSCGAISMFVGTTRDYFEEKKVLCLEYEAYEPMALKTMNKICDGMRSQWPDIKHIAIYHRLGTVPVKEASVVIAVSSPHRQTSLLSVQFAIDELKKSVPIWKKEQYEDSGAAWKENKECSFGGKLKRPKLDFEQCNVETSSIPKNLVQIGADPGEVARRIQSFIEKKREEIDVNNVMDFTIAKAESRNGDGESCARVNSIVMKQKDSKGHLKVQRVKNLSGPQMKVDYAGTLDKLMGRRSNSQQEAPTGLRIKQEPGESFTHILPTGVAERIENAEKFLNIIPNTSKDVYERIKAIEDRILFLETISPEYHHFLNPKSADSKKILKKTYSVRDLDGYIQQLKQNISEGKTTT